MTELEKEIFDRINGALFDTDRAKVAAVVAREWIIKAVKDSSETHMQEFLQDWFIENDKNI